MVGYGLGGTTVIQILQTILRRTGLQLDRRLATQASCSLSNSPRSVEEIMSTRSPLDEMNETSLYHLLGEAWYAQLKTKNGAGYFLPSNIDVGKREFDAVAPILTEALRQPYFQGVSARIASALEVEALWNMPTSVVAALAHRRGMITKRFGEVTRPVFRA
jgi:hypothetical protein